MVAPRVRFYMLTEDSGSHSHATWVALLRRMCRLVDPDCQTQAEVFAVEAPEKEVRETMAGKGAWRSRRLLDHGKRVHFWRTIADQLEAKTVVVFHVDGDEVWRQRERSQNVRDVQEIALRQVRKTLEDHGRGADEIRKTLAYFVPMHPFVEIESWLFHNYAAIRRIHERRRAVTPSCVAAWEATPRLLDEVTDPKAALPGCKGHHRELAEEAFPADLVDVLGSSFHEAVNALRSCAPLLESLRGTYSPDRWQQSE